MRIAIPIHSFEPGGVERVALRLAERWRDEGHDVVIVLGRDRGHCRDAAPALDYWSLREPFATERWETIWLLWTMARFLLLAPRADVIFCPGNTYTVVCVVMKVLFGGGCPPVLAKVSNDLTRQDLPPAWSLPYRWWLRMQGIFLERFVALAEPMRAEIERGFHCSRARVAVIPDPALSRAELAALSSGPDRAQTDRPGSRFLAIGRLVPQKNHALLLEAFARHAWPDDELFVAGSGPEREGLESAIAQLGIAGRVSLMGHVDDVAALLARTDVFVLSSDYEGVPAAIIEALAAGLPIAATDCCASMDWLTGRGKFGVLCPPGDPDALGAAMNLARHMIPDRAAARRLVEAFTLEASSKLYLGAFSSLAGRRGAMRHEKFGPAMRDSETGGV